MTNDDRMAAEHHQWELEQRFREECDEMYSDTDYVKWLIELEKDYEHIRDTQSD